MIDLTTPRGEGYTACLKGLDHGVCPYQLSDILKWDEWINGWYEALNAGLYGKDSR